MLDNIEELYNSYQAVKDLPERMFDEKSPLPYTEGTHIIIPVAHPDIIGGKKKTKK